MTPTAARERGDYWVVAVAGLPRGDSYKKLRDPWLLGDFVGYLEAVGASMITSEAGDRLGRYGPARTPSLVPGQAALRGARLAPHVQAFYPATEVSRADVVP